MTQLLLPFVVSFNPSEQTTEKSEDQKPNKEDQTRSKKTTEEQRAV